MDNLIHFVVSSHLTLHYVLLGSMWYKFQRHLLFCKVMKLARAKTFTEWYFITLLIVHEILISESYSHLC